MSVRKFALVFLLCLLPSVAAGADAAPKADAAVVAPAPAKAPASQPAAPAVPVTVDEAVGTFQGIVKSFTSQHVRAGIAGCICVLVFLWRRFGAKLLIGKIPNKFLPLVTTGVAFLAAVPVALVISPWSWTTFLWQGLITGAEAMLFWSTLAKFVLPSIPATEKK